jgi:WD40 repeat protein
LSVRATGRGIRVYDAATGEPASPILPHATAVRFAVFNADGTRLVTSDDDDTARVWDVATGAALAPSKVISGTLTGVRFDESGERAIFTNSGGRERIWDLGPDQRPVEDLVRLARVLAYGWIDDEQNRQFFDAPGLKAAWQSLNGSPEARK